MAAVHARGETSGGAGSSGEGAGRGGQCGVGVQGTRKGVCEPGSRAPEERRGERRAPRSPVGSAAPVPGPQPAYRWPGGRAPPAAGLSRLEPRAPELAGMNDSPSPCRGNFVLEAPAAPTPWTSGRVGGPGAGGCAGTGAGAADPAASVAAGRTRGAVGARAAAGPERGRGGRARAFASRRPSPLAGPAAWGSSPGGVRLGLPRLGRRAVTHFNLLALRVDPTINQKLPGPLVAPTPPVTDTRGAGAGVGGFCLKIWRWAGLLGFFAKGSHGRGPRTGVSRSPTPAAHPRPGAVGARGAVPRGARERPGGGARRGADAVGLLAGGRDPPRGHRAAGAQSDPQHPGPAAAPGDRLRR